MTSTEHFRRKRIAVNPLHSLVLAVPQHQTMNSAKWPLRSRCGPWASTMRARQLAQARLRPGAAAAPRQPDGHGDPAAAGDPSHRLLPTASVSVCKSRWSVTAVRLGGGDFKSPSLPGLGHGRPTVTSESPARLSPGPLTGSRGSPGRGSESESQSRAGGHAAVTTPLTVAQPGPGRVFIINGWNRRSLVT
jgi:hypothetical protein